MRAIARALNHYRPNEREYIIELDRIRWEIEFLLDFIDEAPINRSLYPVVEDLREKETLIKRALRKLELPPIPDELRNPFTRQRTHAEQEYTKELIDASRTNSAS
jgi:hypothetical protein